MTAPRTAPRIATALAAAGVALLALGAWWLVPRAAHAGAERRAPLRVVLVDASASVVRPRPGWRSWARAALEREARAADDAHEELCVVRFAEDVERLFGPGAPRAFLDELARGPLPFTDRDAETRLDDALAFSERAVEAAGAGRVTVLGDALATGAVPGPALARLAALGASVTRIEPPPPTRPDLALERLSLPDVVEPGAPLRATCTLAWLAAGRADPLALALTIEDADGERELIAALAPPSGAGREAQPDADGRVRWRTAIELGPAAAGLTRVTARARLGHDPGGLAAGRGDAIPENDGALARTSAAGRLVVVASSPAAQRAAVEGWLGPLASAGLQLVWVEPSAVARELATADALVTVDLAPSALPARSAAFVRAGGGWLACGGARFLAGWALEPEDGPATLLPLVPDPGRREPRDVVFLVDGSGSMEGEPFERVRRALAELVDAALPEDRIELVFFTGTLSASVRLTSGTGRESREQRRAALAELMAARVPGGTTAILYSLEELASLRARAAPGSPPGSAPGGAIGGAPRAGLVFLLSDGRDVQAFDTENRARELLERLRAARTRLCVIAVGVDADRAFLERLVAPGETLLVEGAMGDLGALFQRELHRDRRTCGELRLFAAAVEPDTLAAELLRGAPRGAIGPPLECIARAVRAPTGELLWSGPSGEPVCAVQRVGLGATAVFASAPLVGWAPAWTETAELFGPLLRVLGRGARPPAPRAAFVDGRLRIEGLQTPRASVPARLFDAHGAELAELELAALVPTSGPAAGGSAFEASWPLANDVLGPDRPLELRVELDEPTTVWLAAPRAPEFRAAGSETAGWRPLAAEVPRVGAGSPRGPRPAGPWVLAAGLVALSLAVLLGLGRVGRTIQGTGPASR